MENWLLPNQPRIFISVKRLITNTRVLCLLITNFRYTFENVDLIEIPLPYLCWKIRKKTGPTMSISLVKPHSQYQGRACFIKAVHGCDLSKNISWIEGNSKMKSLNSMQISSFWSVKVSERIREWVEILLISILRYQNNYVVSLFIFKWFGNLCRTRSVRKLPILILLLLLEASLENEKESYLLILIEASGFPKNEWLL